MRLSKKHKWSATGVFDVPSASDGDTAPIEAAESDLVALTLRPMRRVTKRLEREDGSVPAAAAVSLYPVVEGDVIYRAKRDVRTDGDGSVDFDENDVAPRGGRDRITDRNSAPCAVPGDL